MKRPPQPSRSSPRQRSRTTFRVSGSNALGAPGKTEMATILVVEDEFGITEVLQSALTDAGHNVVTAINGKQGLELLKESGTELVILDFMMPVLDGLGMLRAM